MSITQTIQVRANPVAIRGVLLCPCGGQTVLTVAGAILGTIQIGSDGSRIVTQANFILPEGGPSVSCEHCWREWDAVDKATVTWAHDCFRLPNEAVESSESAALLEAYRQGLTETLPSQ